MVEYSQFVSAVSEKTGITEKETKRMLETTREVIMETLRSGERLRWKGIGTFERKVRPAREVRNPKTKETVMCAGSATIRLSVSGSAKEALK